MQESENGVFQKITAPASKRAITVETITKPCNLMVQPRTELMLELFAFKLWRLDDEAKFHVYSLDTIISEKVAWKTE